MRGLAGANRKSIIYDRATPLALSHPKSFVDINLVSEDRPPDRLDARASTGIGMCGSLHPHCPGCILCPRVNL
jgi:hypothetical protein